MALGYVGFDHTRPVGQKFTNPQVIAEIQALSPLEVAPGGITNSKIAPLAVTRDKVAAKTLTGAEMADGAVGTVQLANDAVTTVKLGAKAVTGPKAGAGVLKVKDSAGNDIEITLVPITQNQYDALATKDPAVLYGIY